MGKRVTFFFLFILISALAVMVYIFQQNRRSLFTDPYEVIPSGACIIIETVDLQGFMNTLVTDKGLFGELGNIDELDNFNRKLFYLTDRTCHHNSS